MASAAAPDPATDLDRLLSVQALRELSAAYCASLDRADAALMLSLFHADGAVITGDERTPIADYAPAAIAAVLADTLTAYHVLSNERFAIDGDRATGESYVQATSIVAGPEGESELRFAGRYLDRFERRDGRWAFLTRTFILDWSRAQPSRPIEGLPFPRGARGAADPAEQMK